MNEEQSLQRKIDQKKAKLCVLGLGYVGLPLAIRFAEAGFPVTGIDVEENKVKSLKKGVSYVPDVPSNKLRANSFRPSTDFSLLKGSDVVIICLPTPLSKTRDPDLSLVLEGGRAVAEHLHQGQLVVLESTTYPGTTRELLLPLLENTGLGVGKDFFLAYSPERIDPGNQKFDLVNTPKIIAGVTPSCLKLVQALYEKIVDRLVPVSKTDAAEMVKLLENIFRSVNIALVNEFAIMCHRLDLNVWEVIDAAATKPFGYLPFYPGPGLGGHCIPVDPHYLSWKLKLLAYKPRFIELSDEVNREMPRFVVDKVVDALNRQRKSVMASKILILGVAYKKNSNDVRESPALDIMKYLYEKGAKLYYHDPYVPEVSFNGEVFRSVPLNAESLSSAEAVVIVTDHSQFKPANIVSDARLIIDTRNLTQGVESDKIVRL